MPQQKTTDYWFPAKRYGWGWGFPVCWQGWLVMLGYIACIVGSIPLLKQPSGGLIFAVIVPVATIALVVICWIKGEPPRWRWGDQDD